jgi:hypothetical protein
VAEDLLQAEDVAAVDEVAAGETAVKEMLVRPVTDPAARGIARPALVRALEAESPSDNWSGLRWTIGNAIEMVADRTILADMIRIAKNQHNSISVSIASGSLSGRAPGRVPHTATQSIRTERDLRRREAFEGESVSDRHGDVAMGRDSGARVCGVVLWTSFVASALTAATC